MNYARILKSGAKLVTGPSKLRVSTLLPPTPTHPPVNDNQELDDVSANNLKKRRSEAAVYATAQQGTVAGYPVQPPNY
jgi:hypothetical protein